MRNPSQNSVPARRHINQPTAAIAERSLASACSSGGP